MTGLSSWMKLFMQLLQAGTVNMSVNLRGRNVRMAEQLLHNPKVRSALQQMGRKRMSQRVWADVFQACFLGHFFEF